MKKFVPALSALVFAVSAHDLHAAPDYADWLTPTNGLLGATQVTVQGTTRADISVLNGSFTGFSNSAYFSPAIASTDAIGMQSAESFTLAFSQPVAGLAFHIWQLGDTTLNFSESFNLLSSDGDLVQIGNTLRGPGTSADDANGTIMFPGSMSSLSWFASDINFSDGIRIQLSANAQPIPEPSTQLMFTVAMLLLGLRMASRRQSRKTDA